MTYVWGFFFFSSCVLEGESGKETLKYHAGGFKTIRDNLWSMLKSFTTSQIHWVYWIYHPPHLDYVVFTLKWQICPFSATNPSSYFLSVLIFSHLSMQHDLNSLIGHYKWCEYIPMLCSVHRCSEVQSEVWWVQGGGQKNSRGYRGNRYMKLHTKTVCGAQCQCIWRHTSLNL